MLIAQSNILQLLSKEQRVFLDAKGHQLTLKAGDFLFEKGDCADHVFLVKKGKLTLYRLMPNGEQKVFKVFLSGGVIAEMAVFMEPRVYPMTAYVEQCSELVCYSHHTFHQLFKADRELALKVIGFMSNLVGQLMNSIDMLTQVNANQRLVMYFAEIYQKQKQSNNRFVLPSTKKVLATQLGITPETLSRLLNKLKFRGLIKESGACITIPDISDLCHEVDLVPTIFEPYY
ncbi:MAG: Crp/Fnr family transcriptional regulator [Litorilituus sp.]|jgi:CRP/FNR family transcriptional regulator|nr:Crp/Fnr family transcriptional regulator [Litorilituus sp.]